MGPKCADKRQPGSMWINLIMAGLWDSLSLLASDWEGRRCESTTPRRQGVSDSGSSRPHEGKDCCSFYFFYFLTNTWLFLICLLELVICLFASKLPINLYCLGLFSLSYSNVLTSSCGRPADKKNKQWPLLRPTSTLISCVYSCIVLVALDSWFFPVFAPLLSFQCCLLRVEHSVWTAQRTVHHLCGSSTCMATGHSKPAVKLWSQCCVFTHYVLFQPSDHTNLL